MTDSRVGTNPQQQPETFSLLQRDWLTEMERTTGLSKSAVLEHLRKIAIRGAVYVDRTALAILLEKNRGMTRCRCDGRVRDLAGFLCLNH